MHKDVCFYPCFHILSSIQMLVHACIPDYGRDIINKEDIKCSFCHNIVSYDDGFTEFLADLNIGVLLSIPICAGVLEFGNWKIKVGKATKIQFKTPFYEIYNVTFPRPVDTDEKLFEQIILKPVEVNTDDFVAKT